MDNDFILVQNKRSKKKHKVDDNTTIINNHRTKKSNKMIIYDQYTNNINNISNINNTYDIAELFIKPKNSIIIKHTDQLCVDITYQNNNIDNDNKNSDIEMVNNDYINISYNYADKYNVCMLNIVNNHNNQMHNKSTLYVNLDKNIHANDNIVITEKVAIFRNNFNKIINPRFVSVISIFDIHNDELSNIIKNKIEIIIYCIKKLNAEIFVLDRFTSNIAMKYLYNMLINEKIIFVNYYEK